MTVWTDKSDSKSRFFDGGECKASSVDSALAELFSCLQTRILGNGTATNFDLLLFEVNCDTGRLIAAATTSDKHASGQVDGCSLRVQEVQDFWYDLLDSGPSDQEFSVRITEHVRELGNAFRNGLMPYLEELRRSCASSGFSYRVYGGEPGVAIYEEAFPVM